MKKNILIVIVCVIAVAAGIFYYFSKKNKTNEYYWRTVSVEKGDVSVMVTATGSMAADTSVDVGVQVSGIIATIKVDFNDVVKRGQVIAVLDTTLYYAAQVDAEATYKRAKVAEDEAKKEYDRAKTLLDNKVEAQADYDVAFTAWLTAQGNTVSAKAQLDKAVINLQYCTITAPISGVIIARNVQIGNMVIASFSSPVLFTIAYDLKKMQVQADVDEADIGQVKNGQQAKFTVDAYPNDVFTGVVTQIRRQPVIVQNVVNYVVIIEVANPDLKLMPGLTANSNIYIQNRKNVLKVPTNAFAFTPPVAYIQSENALPDSVKKFWLQKLRQTSELKKQQIIDQTTAGYLWVTSGTNIFPVQVTKGLNDGTFTEITASDIEEGYNIALGINTTPTAAITQTASSPFMPKFPSSTKK